MSHIFRISITVIAAFSSLLTMAQSDLSRMHTAAADLQRRYNSAAYDSIFQSFTPEMQKALPMDATADFFGGLRMESGGLQSLEYKGLKSGAGQYKAGFERGVSTMLLYLANDNRIGGLRFMPFEDPPPPLARNTTPLRLPFKGEWTVVWGGDTKEQNYHVESLPQRGAYDLIITDASGQSYRNTGKRNEDYYCWKAPLYAPADAEVVMAVDGVPDNVPGEMNTAFVPGNSVVLKTVSGEYLHFAHFVQGSVAVRKGQKLKAGALLGLTGNSGNSSEPHLHFHVQTTADITKGVGIKTYFKDLEVMGQRKSEHALVKGEKVKPLNATPGKK